MSKSEFFWLTSWRIYFTQSAEAREEMSYSWAGRWNAFRWPDCFLLYLVALNTCTFILSEILHWELSCILLTSSCHWCTWLYSHPPYPASKHLAFGFLWYARSLVHPSSFHVPNFDWHLHSPILCLGRFILFIPLLLFLKRNNHKCNSCKIRSIWFKKAQLQICKGRFAMV